MALPDHLTPLLQADAYPHRCGAIELVETHISWVILTGEVAYKLKKPVRFAFVDFSTLERRAHFCREELRCNRTFAPMLYQDVVAVVRGEDGQIRMSGQGEVLEWAVQMQQFPADAQLDRLLDHDGVEPGMLAEFGHSLAVQHQRLPGQPLDAAELYQRVFAPMLDNFTDLAALPLAAPHGPLLERARRATEAQYQSHAPVLARRLEQGWIRECHGDLHLSNLVLLDGTVVAFDCLEFNPNLRWIDPQSDVAFLFMDCLLRDRADLGYAFIDGYLDETGDYQGVTLLPLYAGYRSMVRAKVAALRHGQAGASGEAAALEQRCVDHVRWAAEWLSRPPGRLILTCGLSGSGKSFLAQRLAPLLPAVRLRSDVARKAQAGLAPRESRRAAPGAGLYQAQTTREVYAQLLELAGDLLRSGEHVIVDATFLDQDQRQPFLALAAALGRPAVVLYCHAPQDVLRQRVAARSAGDADPSDADLAVLDHQLARFEPPAADAIAVDTRSELSNRQLLELQRRLLDR